MVKIKRSISTYAYGLGNTVVQYLKVFALILPIVFVIRTFFYGLYQVPTGSMEVTMLVGERFFVDKFSFLFKNPIRGDIITFNDPRFDYSDNLAVNLFQRYVWGPKNWTKRVIGVPGDHVIGKIEGGRPVVYVNGKLLDEPYVNKNPLIAIYRDDVRHPIEFRSWDRLVPFDKQPYYAINEDRAKHAPRVLHAYPRPTLSTLEPFTPTVEDGKLIDEFDVVLDDNEFWVMGDNRKNSIDSRVCGAVNKKLIHGKVLFRISSIDSYDRLNANNFWNRIRWNRFFQWVH